MRQRLAGRLSSFLITQLGHQVRLSEQLEFLPFHLQLGSPELWQEDLVPHGDRHGEGGAGLGPSAGTYSHHQTLVDLGLGLLGDVEAALGLGLGSGSLQWEMLEIL